MLGKIIFCFKKKLQIIFMKSFISVLKCLLEKLSVECLQAK